MNAAAGQTVNLVESWYSLALRVYGMVSSVGTIVEPSREVIACKVATAQVQHAATRRTGGKATMATIRRLGAVVAFALLLATVPAGAAFAAVTVGTAGDDWLQGAGNADALYGLDGDDQLFGKGASDELYGGRGEDTLHGGRGADYLTGGTKLDTFFAGNGNDFVDSADGGPDDVLCGRGTGDRAALDPEDIATGCEILVNGEDAQAEK